MARVHRSSGRTLTAGARRKSTWLFLDGTFNTMIALGGTLVGTLNAAALALRPFTVVRTYLSGLLFSDQAAAIEDQVAGVGVCVVSDQAFAVGVTAVPTPISDIGSDLWFSHKLLWARESSLTDRTNPSLIWELDSKAMRKVDAGQDLAVVIEMDDIGDGVRLGLGGRFLIKLH